MFFILLQREKKKMTIVLFYLKKVKTFASAMKKNISNTNFWWQSTLSWCAWRDL